MYIYAKLESERIEWKKGGGERICYWGSEVISLGLVVACDLPFLFFSVESSFLWWCWACLICSLGIQVMRYGPSIPNLEKQLPTFLTNTATFQRYPHRSFSIPDLSMPTRALSWRMLRLILFVDECCIGRFVDCCQPTCTCVRYATRLIPITLIKERVVCCVSGARARARASGRDIWWRKKLVMWSYLQDFCMRDTSQQEQCPLQLYF